MNKEFDFKRYQSLGRNWRVLIRILVYIAVIFFLLYLIFYQDKTKGITTNTDIIEDFQIEISE